MLGGDPEFFILDPKGTAVPAHVFVPSKEAPLVVDGAGKIFRDGFAVEMNPLPSPNITLLIGNMAKLFAKVYSLLPSGYKLSATSTVPINLESLIQDAPDDVLMSGCSPSFNAYGKGVELPSLRYYPMRHAGGHIHLSPLDSEAWPLTRPDLYPQIVMVMDFIIGSRIYEIMDRQDYKMRSAVYGKWGEYRPQNYPGNVKGLEYRVLGNEIWSHPALAVLAYGLARYVVLNMSTFHYGEAIMNRYMTSMPEMVNYLPGGIKFSTNSYSIPGFYSPLTIRALRMLFKDRSLTVSTRQFSEWAEDGLGWKDWCEQQKLPACFTTIAS